MSAAGLETLEAARRDFLRAMTGAGVVTFFLDLLQLVTPLYMMQVFDRVMSSRSMDTLVMLTVIAAAGLFFYAVLDYLRGRVFIAASHSVTGRLNAPAFEAAVIKTLKGDSANPNQAIRDLNDLRQFISGSTVMVPLEVVFSPFFLFVMFLLHPMYGVVAVIGSVLLFGLSLANEMATRRPIVDANDAAVKSYAEVGTAVRHGEVLEAMGMTGTMARRWRASQNHFVGRMIAGSDRSKLITAISKAVRMFLQIAVMATGVVLVLKEAASPGSIFACTIIMGRALMPFEQMIEGYRQWLIAHAAYRRIRDLLASTDSRRHGLALPAPEGRLKAERVVFVPAGHDRAIIKGVSFQLEPGEALGIIGPSGSGKSTLARLLVGVWEPTAGGVYLDGHNVYTWNRENFGRYVGYLPQSVGLLDGTIRENIARMEEADPRDVVAAARRADVHEMIGRLPFGYETSIADANFVLSGGQRQRIGLARALFGRPRLIVLDEPNSNLDQAGEAALVRAIGEAKAEGSTVVMIAHRPSVLACVDKVLVMRDGMVESFGPRDEIIRSGPSVAALAARSDSSERVEADKVARLPQRH